MLKNALIKSTKLASLCLLLATVHVVSAQQQIPGGAPPTSSNPAPSANAPGPSAPPPNTGSSQTAPSANAPQGQSSAPPSNAQPLSPGGQVQQSAQPAVPPGQQQQQSGTGTAAPPVAPAGSSAPGSPTAGGAPDAIQPSQPGTGVTAPQGATRPGIESVVSPAPSILPNVPEIAPNFRANPAGPLPELGRVGVSLDQQRPITVREAIEMALANNKDIEVARQNVRIAEFDLRGAAGVYDPRLSSLSYYERIVSPVSSLLSGGSVPGQVKQTNLTGTARLEGLTPFFGGGYRVDFSTLRTTTDNQFVAINPQFPTALTFNYTQPLLRGLRFDGNRRLIEISKKNLQLTDAQFRQRAVETITGVQSSYWDLAFALRNLQIQRDAVRDARAQLEHNRRLVEEGLLAPIDVVAADAQVSGFEQSVYSALQEVSRAENALKNLIAENRLSAMWNVSLVPVDPVDLQSPPVALDQALQTALTNRAELQQSDVSRAINELDQRFYRDQTRAQIDVVGSYGVAGLAGAQLPNTGANPFTQSTEQLRLRINELSVISGLAPLPPPPDFQGVLPPELIGGYGQSFVNLAANRYPNFRVGVQVGIPIRNRTAEAQLGRSLVEGQRITTQREQLEQLIQVDVRNALQIVRTAESRLRAAAAARSASEQQYASEQRRFDAGQSTFFLLLERQTALTTARGNELRAQTDLNKALADLQRATGNALEANKVSVSVR